jgi:hypothetical protein
MGIEVIGMALAGASMVMNANAAEQRSQAEKNAYAYQAGVQANNAKLAEMQAQDALQRGAKEEQNQRLKTAMLKSNQTATLAARGLDLSSGSPLDILTTTDFMGERDARTIGDNAAKEAWAARVRASSATSDSQMLQSRSDAENPGQAYFGSLVSGAGQVASSWYKYNKGAATDTYIPPDP